MLKGPTAKGFEGVESCGILKLEGFWAFFPKQVYVFGSILGTKETGHTGAGLGAHRVFVCLKMCGS